LKESLVKSDISKGYDSDSTVASDKIRSNKDILGLLLLLLVPLILNGCMSFPIQGGENSVHYLIIGVGMVTVPKPEKETAILATKSQALGVSLTDQPGLVVGIGYSSSTVIAIPDGAEDVRVEVSQKPGGPLIIAAPKADLSGKKP
jgi:hypothetical protein